MEYWERALRDSLLSVDELLQQLLALYQRYPREFLGAALLTGILIFIWPSPPEDEYIPSGISMRGLRQRFAFSQSDRIEKRERPDDSLDLDDINALLQRFERRTRVINVAAYRQGPRWVRTVRVSGSYNQAVVERELPVPISRKLNYSDREALTAHVLRVISRHGKRGIDRRSLASAIVSESIRQNYDPLFVAAVIKSESAFNTYARSYVGAQGLMQIMPATARYVESINEIPRGNLSDPGHNLHLGVKYLKYLEEMYKGNRILTLMAYNWGPGHVDKTIKAGSRRGVPREVVNYALRILGDHAQWVDEVNKQRGRSKAT
jgi:soluble lytic murein transglycosylase